MWKHLMLTVFLVACGGSKADAPKKETTTKEKKLVAKKSADDILRDKVAAMPNVTKNRNLADVVAKLKPHFHDIDVGKPVGAGEIAFAVWALKHPASLWLGTSVMWGEKALRTSYVLVRKDSDGERGKVLCEVVKVLSIGKTKTDIGDIYEGSFMTSEQHIVNFLVPHDSDGVVEGTVVPYCGIVTGRRNYENVSRRITTSVQTIGVFLAGRTLKAALTDLCKEHVEGPDKCMKAVRPILKLPVVGFSFGDMLLKRMQGRK